MISSPNDEFRPSSPVEEATGQHADSSESPIHASTPIHASSGGFAEVGRKLRSRTTDLLAVSIILIAGLTLGDQISQWWRVDPDEMQSPTELAHSLLGVSQNWGASGEPVGIEFGNSRYQLQRTVFQGDAKLVEAELIAQCRKFATSNFSLPSSTDVVEQRLLQRLKRAKLVEQDNTANWRIDRIDGPMTMFVATRKIPDVDADESSQQSTASVSRVVCWGMAVPKGEAEWLLYLFYASGQSGILVGELPKIELPPGSRQVMSLRTELGGALITFAGEGDPKEWQHFFDDWFLVQGGESNRRWESSGNSWYQKYKLTVGKSRGRIDIVLYRDQNDRLNGTINVTVR